MSSLDYFERIIQSGDAGSNVMYELIQATCAFRPEVKVLDESRGGLTGLSFPKGAAIVIHSATGDPSIGSSREYAASLVENLVSQARSIGAEPLAFTDTLDMSEISLEVINQAALGLYQAAKQYSVALLNGEIAGLGNRVNAPFNISGTMVSYLSGNVDEQIFERNNNMYISLLTDGRLVFMNSDGVGTKIEISERRGQDENMPDLLAMLTDDAAKKRAEIRAISSVLETKSVGIISKLWMDGYELSKNMGVYFSLQHEILGERINGFGNSPYNLGGTCVSYVDEHASLPVSVEGDYLVALRSKSNKYTYRSNGLTPVRKIFKDLFGEYWHNAMIHGKLAGEWANAPSTVFYPFARQLFEENLITGFYHMSGGAFKGKLADPLAKAGLSARLDNLFEPSPAMTYLIEKGNLTCAEAYQLWNMGNEAFVSTKDPLKLSNALYQFDLEGKLATSTPMKKGSGLNIKTYTGEEIRF